MVNSSVTDVTFGSFRAVKLMQNELLALFVCINRIAFDLIYQKNITSKHCLQKCQNYEAKCGRYGRNRKKIWTRRKNFESKTLRITLRDTKKSLLHRSLSILLFKKQYHLREIPFLTAKGSFSFRYGRNVTDVTLCPPMYLCHKNCNGFNINSFYQ